ncbi:unnamed protein product, partial [Mesorhabditis belari]|uniref:Uncharacterized protein n=1 Tax=Mesorhabditis belari TaxID=2138241 RepID=A0AAF3EKD9_9BILA
MVDRESIRDEHRNDPRANESTALLEPQSSSSIDRPEKLMGEDDIVYVLEDGDLEVRDRANEDIQSPLRSVNNVLQEAENLLTDGPLEKPLKSRTRVLMDEVDVEFSPVQKHSIPGQPIEVVVRHSKVTAKGRNGENSDEDDDNEDMNGTSKNTNHTEAKRKTSKLGVLREGEQEEFYRQRDREEGLGSSRQNTTKSTPSGGWKKGHRRAFSMPNAKGEKMTLAVIQDHKQSNDGNLHSRKIVRYRLHANKAIHGGKPITKAIFLPEKNNRREATVRFDEIRNADSDDDNELEVEINEEEITYPGDLGTGKGSRTVMKRFWEARWKVQNFEMLPDWLQDNEYLRTGHRPPLASFSSCFKSIFAIHTETGNIWTHMYGCVAFIGIALWFLTRPADSVQFMEKLIFSAFFFGAVVCMGMSFVFHTVQCHSDHVSKFFSKLDYTGISLLIVGSFIPWIYYGFYCRPQPMIIYITMISILGIAAMIVSLWDKFAEPKFRPVRAGVFVAMGLSSIFPAIHFFVTDGFWVMWNEAGLMWLLVMGFFYLFGAALYATRIPERFFPGKCDYWFQSHQLFHTFVVLAAFIHFHGITEVAMKRLEKGSCAEQLLQRYGVESNPTWLGTLLGLDQPPDTINWTPDPNDIIFKNNTL